MSRSQSCALVVILAATAVSCGTSSAYDRAYERETQRLEEEARRQEEKANAAREEAERYAAVVYFDVGSATIKADGYQELDWFVEKVKVDPTVTIHVRGFADATGGDTVNQKLSEERAGNVARYLVSKGIEERRIAPLGFSSEFPADPGKDAKAYRSNRRVEVTAR